MGLFDEEVSKEVPSKSESSLQRYEDQGQLGEGGMGEVRRVRDPELLRSIAMKIAHPKLSISRGALARFMEEAQDLCTIATPQYCACL